MQILRDATRQLGMSEQAVGLSFIGIGLGTVTAGVLGHRISRRLGPGAWPSLC